MKINTTHIKMWQLILFIQFLTDVAIIFDIPVIRPVMGFVYLTFVLGFIVLDCFKFKNIDMTQVLLFSLGFSIAFLMFFGFLLNELLLLSGIQNPLSTRYLIIGMNIFVIIYCLITYFIHIDYDLPILIKKIPHGILYFIILPFVSIFSTIIINSGGSNFLALFLIFFICILYIYAYINHSKYLTHYYIILFLCALSLILLHSTITKYIVGYDIHKEFYIFKLTENVFHWDSFISSSNIDINRLNGMLSITILPTIYSQILNVDGTIIFKFLYPFILSCLIIGIYRLYCIKFDSQTSFLSTLFFMTNSVFFMLFSTRQIVAEIFYILLFIVLFTKNIPILKKSICYFIFSAAMIVSHYSITYIYLFMITIMWIITSLFLKKYQTIKINYIIYTLVFSFFWYIYISDASSFKSFIDTINFIFKNIYRDLFDLETRGILIVSALGGGDISSVWHQIGRIFFYISELLIILGFIQFVINRYRERQLFKEYNILIYLNFFIIMMCIVLPNFAKALQITRFYQITLLILAPMCIIGGKIILSLFMKKNYKSYGNLIIIIFFIVPFFLFQSGFIYSIVGDSNWSIPLSIKNGRVTNLELYNSVTNEQEVFGANWLRENTGDNSNLKRTIYADRYSSANVLTSYGMIPMEEKLILTNTTNINTFSYIYLRKINIVDGIIDRWNIDEFSSELNIYNKIYTNSNCNIYNYSP